jgi:hypothetical protein
MLKKESLWEQFTTALSHEFLTQTGFGIYAYITPIELDSAYKEFEDNEVSIQNYVHNYVQNFVRSVI